MTRRRTIPHLFRQWQDVATRIRAKRRAVVFLDFDGTIVRIAARPDRVRMKPAMQRALQRLALNPRMTVAVISGRRRDELRRCVGIAGLHYLGLYGWERGDRKTLPAPARVALFRAHLLLRKKLTAFPRVWIEPKRNSFSVHLLGAKPEAQRRVRRLVRRALHHFRGTLRLLENLRDIEVMPRHIPDKGAAVREFLAKPAYRGTLPFFFGDDLSDEPAFAAVSRGVPVLVGQTRKTRARFRVRGPHEVAAALTRLEEALA
jgi:trehalose 6-phosphate phosphatase